MYFINYIKEKYKEEKLDIYVDMDGVIADYDIYDNPYNYKNKRPLYTNINTIKELSLLNNINIFILSICRTDEDIYDKNNWLNEYCSFIKKDNINILSKQSYPNILSKDLKYNFIKNIESKNKIILIDDDNEILHYIKNKLVNIDVYQDSSLLD